MAAKEIGCGFTCLAAGQHIHEGGLASSRHAHQAGQHTWGS